MLLIIHSPDLAAALADYQKALADAQLARKQLERAQLLYDMGAVAQRDLEVPEDSEQRAQVDLRASEERLRALGADPARPSALAEVKAPISGTIVEQNTTGGTGVRSLDNSPNPFTIADLSRAWVLCEAYEDMLARVHLGDAARVTLTRTPSLCLTCGASSRAIRPRSRSTW